MKGPRVTRTQEPETPLGRSHCPTEETEETKETEP